MNEQQRKQMSDLLEELSKLLDVTENEFKIITNSYEAVGKYLAEDSSPLREYEPSIHPQGSFLLGTVVRPIKDEEDFDIDLVCELNNKPKHWTQYDVKQLVGKRLQYSDLYKTMLDKEGKRCWTLKYADNKYHLDILPAVVGKQYRSLVENYFSQQIDQDPKTLAIKITDNTRPDYTTECNENKWLTSNPFGYAKWFLMKAQPIQQREQGMLAENKIDPVPKFGENRLILQRVVQLLKRHRNIMFEGKEDKPISIIITTLAANIYNKETNIFDALERIVANLKSSLDKKNGVYWVANPVNPEENFADRWPSNPNLERNFNSWCDKLQKDLKLLNEASGTGLENIKKILVDMFGDKITTRLYENYAARLSTDRNNNRLFISSTGILGSTGVAKATAHTFYGSREETL